MLHQPSGRKGPSPQRHTYTKMYNRPHPHPSPPRSSGVTIVGPTTAIDTHTHNLAELMCPRRSRHHWHLLCTRARHRDGVDMPGTGLHQHREAMHKQHTEAGPSCCVPFGDPHVQKVTPSDETKLECNHNHATTFRPVHHMAGTHRTDDKSKGRRKEKVHEQRVLCEY